jgi:hypothetical protein
VIKDEVDVARLQRNMGVCMVWRRLRRPDAGFLAHQSCHFQKPGLRFRAEIVRLESFLALFVVPG